MKTKLHMVHFAIFTTRKLGRIIREHYIKFDEFSTVSLFVYLFTDKLTILFTVLILF